MDDIPYIEVYRMFCKRASEDDETFKTFKLHPTYGIMLEHLTPEQGLQYLDVIKERNPHLLNHIDKFKENDRLGTPRVTEYRGAGFVSPTTLRYVKVLSDLIEIFDTLDNEEIIELGAGYGGQCKIISCIFSVKSYVMIDLPEVVGLINRYITATKVPNAKAITLEEVPDSKWGLFISNYAFTELPKELQRIYIDKVLNKCEHGYITCNFTSNEGGIDSLPKEKLLEEIKHECIIMKEFPLTHPRNCLLIW